MPRPESNDGPDARQATVTLEIQRDARPVYLTGLVAREVPRGRVNLEIPALEHRGETFALAFASPAGAD
jgi:hypothetical protein